MRYGTIFGHSLSHRLPDVGFFHQLCAAVASYFLGNGRPFLGKQNKKASATKVAIETVALNGFAPLFAQRIIIVWKFIQLYKHCIIIQQLSCRKIILDDSVSKTTSLPLPTRQISGRFLLALHWYTLMLSGKTGIIFNNLIWLSQKMCKNWAVPRKYPVTTQNNPFGLFQTQHCLIGATYQLLTRKNTTKSSPSNKFMFCLSSSVSVK